VYNVTSFIDDFIDSFTLIEDANAISSPIVYSNIRRIKSSCDTDNISVALPG
jgi:hypothetical protein